MHRMKSKSSGLPLENVGPSKAIDFVKYYENVSARELSPKRQRTEGDIRLSKLKSSEKTPSSSQKDNKKTKKVKTDSKLLQGSMEVLPANTSTHVSKSTRLKPIIINSSHVNSVEHDDVATSSPRKKRNKSVSFMLYDMEETVIKKVKSNEAIETPKTEVKRKHKKSKKRSQNVKENISQVESLEHQHQKGETNDSNKKIKKHKLKVTTLHSEDTDAENNEPLSNATQNHKESSKNKQNKVFSKEKIGNECESSVRRKIIKKLNDKCNKSETDLEPEVISEDLENLSIGDNAHTITHLLDDMKVVDKNQIKKNRKKSESEDKKEEKEKIKWKKRKWNKDRKLVTGDKDLLKSVVINGLPLHCIFEYKKLLQEHLKDCGSINSIGVAEVYSPDVANPVFSCTVIFESEDSVNKALHVAESSFKGNNITLWRPLPSTQTTVAVRSYADLAVHTLSSTFCSAGKIRNIYPLVKGKNTINTAFIEFDGPKAVERAIKFVQKEKLRIGGKKVHISKFQPKGIKTEESENKNNDEEDPDSSTD